MKDWLMTDGIFILVVLIAMFLTFSILKRVRNRFQSRVEARGSDQATIKRVRTLANVLGDVLRVLIAAIGITAILVRLGVDLGPLLVTAGIGGLAIGFGAQSLVKDVISGLFILLENQIRVGDYVKIAGVNGAVQDVNLRTIVLRDLSGNVHVVRSGTITTVTNMTMGHSCYVFDVGVAYCEDVDVAMTVLEEVAANLQEDPQFSPHIVKPLEMFGVDSLGDSAVIIKCRITTKPGQQWTIGREMNRRIKNEFDARGIEHPFPHQTIYFGEPKEGPAPPLNVVGLQSEEQRQKE